MKINKEKYQSFLNVVRKKGSLNTAMTVLDVDDQEEIAPYLEKALKELPEETGVWMTKVGIASAEEEVDDDLFGEAKPKTEKGSNPGKKVTMGPKGHKDPEGPPGLKPDPGTIQHTGGGANVPATGRNERARFKNEDGHMVELETLSYSDKWGTVYVLKEEKELVTVTVKGQPVEVDLVKLRRDPDGMTNGYANSKLMILAEAL